MDRESVLHMDGHGMGAPFARWRSLDGAERSQALQEAVHEIFIEMRLPVYRYLLAVIGSPVDAEDLTQETFIRLFRELSRGTTITNLRSWLLRVAHNLAVDLNRTPDRTRSVGAVPTQEGRVRSRPDAASRATDSGTGARGTDTGAASPQERRCVELRGEGCATGRSPRSWNPRAHGADTSEPAIRKVMRGKS